MNCKLLSFTSLLFLCLCGSSTAQQLAFELKNVDGSPVVVAAGVNQLTAVCFLGAECPMAKAYAGRLNDLQAQYADRGVQIVGVFSNHQDSLQDVVDYVAAQKAKFSAVHDPGNRIADQYGATRTPEVFLLDRDLTLRYHGRIDDQYSPGVARSSAVQEDLRTAIELSLAGEPVKVAETLALGCIIGRAPAATMAQGTESNPESPSAVVSVSNADSSEADSSVTFHRDIVGMLQRNCLECHREGEIGPFAMNEYDEVVGWAETMLETMENKRMPPWHAAPEFGEFDNARHLSPDDLELFRKWMTHGKAEGDPADRPAPVEFTRGWQLPREPDLVVEMRERPFVVPESGVVEYQYFVTELNIEEDRWVSAAEVKPGNASVVHHAIVFIRPPDGSRFRGLGWLGAYVPGQRAQVLPQGHARFLPAGSKLVFQMHYTPSGSEQSDVTRIGLNFIDDSQVSDEVFTLIGIDQEFEIPPTVSTHLVQADVQRIPDHGKLLAITPHMHVRGKSFKLYAGENRDQVMLHVPSYDFNWQHTYVLTEPKPLEELKRLSFDVIFDNSASNPFNPDPQAWVTWGDQTFEEMAVAFFEVSQPRTSLDRERSGRSTATQVSVDSERAKKIDDYVRKLLTELDHNRDGVIRRGETGIVLRRWNFSLWDLDRDDRITESELRTVAESHVR